MQNSGTISFSNIRTNLAGPYTTTIKLSDFTNSGTFRQYINFNPNSISTTNSNIKFSQFYSAAQNLCNSTVQAGTQATWNINNMNPNSKLIWAGGNAYEYGGNVTIFNYGINFYYSFTCTSDLNTNISEFQDNNITLFINNNNYSYTYNGNTNTISNIPIYSTKNNIITANVINTNGPGGFQLSMAIAFPSFIYTDTYWLTDTYCSVNWYNFYNKMSLVNGQGYNPSTNNRQGYQGSDPDVQVQLGNNQGSTLNNLYQNYYLQYSSSFSLNFELNVISSSVADGFYVFIGATSGAIGTNGSAFGTNIYESGGYGSFMLRFQIYNGSIAQGIYLLNGSGTTVASYLTSGFIASAWQPVKINYTMSTTNTWSCYWNGINIFNYSDPNNYSYIQNSGPYWGFGFRDGGGVGSAWVRHVQVYNKPFFYKNVNTSVLNSSNLYARYIASNYNPYTNIWYDSSDNKRHIPSSQITSTGLSLVKISAGNGASNSFTVLAGTTSSVIQLTTSSLLSYTLFTVARYVGTNQYRIFTSNINSTNYWLSGFWGGQNKVAYHEGWLTDNTKGSTTNWIVSSDSQGIYRANNLSYVTISNNYPSMPAMGINLTSNEKSDFQVADVIIYNSWLSTANIVSVENYLMNLYGIV